MITQKNKTKLRNEGRKILFNSNCEKFDDLTRVAPKGKFKATAKEDKLLRLVDKAKDIVLKEDEKLFKELAKDNPQNMGNKGDTMSNTSSGKVKSFEVGYNESNVCPVDEIQICTCGHLIDNHIEQVNGKAISGECSLCKCNYYCQ